MKKLKAVLGITNKTQDNKFIPFLDFDCSKEKEVYKDIYRVMLTFKLSNMFLIKSTNGFNAFSLDKRSFNDCLEIGMNCINIDINYIRYAIEKNNFTLRLGKDKVFINAFFISSNRNNILSKAHYDFFKQYSNFNLFSSALMGNVFKFDKLEFIQLVRFMSKKYGYIEAK